MFVNENNKNYKIIKCDTKLLLDNFTEFNNNYKSKYICIDFEFNAKIALSKKFPNQEIKESRRIALIQINYYEDEIIYVLDPEELSNKQLEIFNEKVFCNTKVKKILHGGDALDMPYIYNKMLNNNIENILDFTKNLYDTRYLCEYFNEDLPKEEQNCQIYEILEKNNVITSQKKKFLEDNETRIGELYDTYIDIHNLSDEVLTYSVYDVVFLVELLQYYIKIDKEIYNNYIPEVSRIVFLHKKNIINLIKYAEHYVTLMNNYMIIIDNNKEILHNIYLLIIELFDDIMIKKIMNINYFRTEMAIVFKFILYDSLAEYFDIYKNKTELYSGESHYESFIKKIKELHYMYFLDIVIEIKKFINGMLLNKVSGGSNDIKQKYAYITLVMRNDNYVPGAIVLAHSLNMTKTKYDKICMITNDVSSKSRKLLKKYYDKVIKVPYIKHKTLPMKSKKQKELYNNWIDVSYTKFNCLLFEEYDKICFLDADLIIINNIDHLFNMECNNAAMFRNYWIENSKQSQNKMSDIPFNGIISPNLVKKGLDHSFVLFGHLIIMKPDKNDYKDYLKYLNSYNIFGFKNCISMADETSISAFQSLIKNRSWSQLDHRYNIILWHLKDLVSPKEKIYIIHCITTPKPWKFINSDNLEWIDYEIWLQFYRDIGFKTLLKNSKICPYCTIYEKQYNIKIEDKNHNFVKDHKIVCPTILKN